MSKIAFENNLLIHKWVRYFLVLQIVTLIIVFGLISLKLPSIAFVLSCTTFVIFIGILGWLYWLYTNHPLVKEKKTLSQQISTLQTDVQKQVSIIKATHKRRGDLTQEKQDEIAGTLKALQTNYIQSGLKSTYIRDAMISGIGNALTERLTQNGIVRVRVFHQAAYTPHQTLSL